MIETNRDVRAVETIDPSYRIECMHHYFEYYADTYPDRTAILGNYDDYTYEEAELKSNELARHLRTLGAEPGAFVAIYFNRSEFPILATLAILKSGACYIPLDIAYPKERIEHIVHDCGVSIILTEEALKESLPDKLPCVIVSIDGDEEQIAQCGTGRIPQDESGLKGEDLSYIIYTSGSTGKPKGILTEHRNVVAFTDSFRKVCQLTYEDRVYQGFSMGFDGSIEEIWQCFSSGATLVTSTNDSAKLASEAARIIGEKKVTFFSTVPTFLAMIEEELPSVKLLILSGEPCRAELVERWATAERRMLNVYGPTETTVNTTSELCVPGKEITIGRALEGYDLYILNEQMAQVPHGDKGELYIGGAGVARGYLHREELTAKTFVPNPFGEGRIYKTGDRVSYNDVGELLFHGRIDNQVKVRGYRIELSELESVLLEFDQVHAAAVKIVEKGGMKQISAFATAAGEAIDVDALHDFCTAKLPRYMVPSFFAELAEMPQTASGKIDRKALPDTTVPFVKSNRVMIGAQSESEKLLHGLWKEIFQLEDISIEDNFFTDLGGYSLLAAELASILRTRHEISIPIREIYNCPTISQLAPLLKEQKKAPQKEDQQSSARDVYVRQGAFKRTLVAALQGISLSLLWGVRAIPLTLCFHFWYPLFFTGELALERPIYESLILFISWRPAMFLLSIVGKWGLVGRYRERKVALGSFTFFRYWLSGQLQGLAGLQHYMGTPILSLYFRLMGAKIGRGVILDTVSLGAYDLISIGDESAISSETSLSGYTVEGGYMHFGKVTIGKGCFVGIHSCLSIGSTMEDGSKLGDLSMLERGAIALKGESYQGSPARKASFELPQLTEVKQGNPLFWSFLHFLGAQVVSLVQLATHLPSAVLVYWAYMSGNSSLIIGTLLLSVPLSILMYVLTVPILKFLILSKAKCGSFSLYSFTYVRKWMVDLLMRQSRSYMHAIYTTIYLAPWLRLMGAKIGKMAEISTVSQVTPDLIEIEDESFFADGSMIGGRHFYRGHFRCDKNRIEKRSFVGNNAILPMGTTLGANSLLGVLSFPPTDKEQIPRDSEWLGSPSFQLPYRQKVEGFAEETMFTPTKKLYLQRYVIDGMRILLPGFITLASSMLLYYVLILIYREVGLWGTLPALPVLALLGLGATLLMVVIIKWLVMKAIKPEIKPLWCTYIWWNELVNGVHETVGAPIVTTMGGTPYVNWYFRLLGSKIGKGVYMETTLFSEFDLVHVGDFCALNQGVVAQNHLFEDRIFKSSYVDIKEGVTLGVMSIVLYDAVVDAGTVIENLSLVMKGETIPTQSRWSGIPVQEKNEC